MSDWGQFNEIPYIRHGSITSDLLNEDKIRHAHLWAIHWLPRLTPQRLLSHNHHVIIWTNQSLTDVLRLSPYVNVKLSHFDHSDQKMLMPPDLNMGVCDTE